MFNASAEILEENHAALLGGHLGTDLEQMVKGLNFFVPSEQRLLKVLQHGEFNIRGWRRADLANMVPDPSTQSRS